ncbi:unnamed protein product [Nezara viridula]|uniref:Uncharacterized protein n=1 Tax=Nezara viridula TaxID=85310 RepID=A0A9P0E0D3_NEZVI|nr:unnamed protein product [Nezara viridula]
MAVETPVLWLQGGAIVGHWVSSSPINYGPNNNWKLSNRQAGAFIGAEMAWLRRKQQQVPEQLDSYIRHRYKPVPGSGFNGLWMGRFDMAVRRAALI